MSTRASSASPGNTSLSSAKAAKQDEFCTQLADNANELKLYKGHFRGKVVLFNCDDHYESNFLKYFASKFNDLGRKRLICTSNGPSRSLATCFPSSLRNGLSTSENSTPLSCTPRNLVG